MHRQRERIRISFRPEKSFAWVAISDRLPSRICQMGKCEDLNKTPPKMLQRCMFASTANYIAGNPSASDPSKNAMPRCEFCIHSELCYGECFPLADLAAEYTTQRMFLPSKGEVTKSKRRLTTRRRSLNELSLAHSPVGHQSSMVIFSSAVSRPPGRGKVFFFSSFNFSTIGQESTYSMVSTRKSAVITVNTIDNVQECAAF